MRNTAIAIAVEDFPQQAWERTFPDPNAVYTFDNIHSPDVPHWTMHSADELPIIDPYGNYRLDVGPGNKLMLEALFDIALEARRILPTVRIKVAPRLYLPSSEGIMVLQKSWAVTEYDTRLEKHGWFPVPTLLLSTNQSAEDAFREMYRFLWMLLETEIPFVNGVPEGIMEEIEAMSLEAIDPIVMDWLSKFRKEPGETTDDYLSRIAQERRAMIFVNMAMDRLGGCWEDDQSPAAELRRRAHDMMMRWALRGTLGQLIKGQYGPIQEKNNGISNEEVRHLLETEEWG